MPLPHFLLMIVVVIAAAGISLLLAIAAGIPMQVLGLVLAIAALVAFLASKSRRTGHWHETPGT